MFCFVCKRQWERKRDEIQAELNLRENEARGVSRETDSQKPQLCLRKIEDNYSGQCHFHRSLYIHIIFWAHTHSYIHTHTHTLINLNCLDFWAVVSSLWAVNMHHSGQCKRARRITFPSLYHAGTRSLWVQIAAHLAREQLRLLLSLLCCRETWNEFAEPHFKMSD